MHEFHASQASWPSYLILVETVTLKDSCEEWRYWLVLEPSSLTQCHGLQWVNASFPFLSLSSPFLPLSLPFLVCLFVLLGNQTQGFTYSYALPLSPILSSTSSYPYMKLIVLYLKVFPKCCIVHCSTSNPECFSSHCLTAFNRVSPVWYLFAWFFRQSSFFEDTLLLKFLLVVCECLCMGMHVFTHTTGCKWRS